MGESSESINKGKFVTKIILPDNVKWSSKNLWKMIPQPADVKANKNNKQKIWWLYLTIFYKKTFKTWNMGKEHVFFIWFWLVFYPFWYCLWRAGAFTKSIKCEQNPLSVTKVIRQQSLSLWTTSNASVYPMLTCSLKFIIALVLIKAM